LFDVCREAYRRALHADATRYPDPLTAPLTVHRADDGSVAPIHFPPGAPPPPTPLWKDAATTATTGGGGGGDEHHGSGSPHDSNPTPPPLAFAQELPQLPSQIRAAVLRTAPVAWAELIRSAGRGSGLGVSSAVTGAGPAKTGWGIRGRL
jgi:hypothetical protein